MKKEDAQFFVSFIRRMGYMMEEWAQMWEDYYEQDHDGERE